MNAIVPTQVQRGFARKIVVPRPHRVLGHSSNYQRTLSSSHHAVPGEWQDRLRSFLGRRTCEPVSYQQETSQPFRRTLSPGLAGSKPTQIPPSQFGYLLAELPTRCCNCVAIQNMTAPADGNASPPTCFDDFLARRPDARIDRRLRRTRRAADSRRSTPRPAPRHPRRLPTRAPLPDYPLTDRSMSVKIMKAADGIRARIGQTFSMIC